jgi:hypothetical protein
MQYGSKEFSRRFKRRRIETLGKQPGREKVMPAS